MHHGKSEAAPMHACVDNVADFQCYAPKFRPYAMEVELNFAILCPPQKGK